MCSKPVALVCAQLYTHTACPYAQRVWIALEATGLPFEKIEVNLYGSGGFDKTQLKKIEAAGGLNPKGYIPVMAIDEEVIRESSVCVDRVASLSTEITGAISLLAERPEVGRELVEMCNALPKSTSSPQLEELIRRVDKECASSRFLAGDTFSVADACLLPFLQRVEADIPNDCKLAEAYMARAHQLHPFEKTVVSSWWYRW